MPPPRAQLRVCRAWHFSPFATSPGASAASSRWTPSRFDVEEGEIHGLIGPNGAGKTTLFNVVTRLYKPDEGEIDFAGESLLHTPPHRIVKRGIARTFQNVNLFKTMTVLDNVLVGAHARRDAGEREALEIIEYVGLGGQVSFPAAALPYGIQKRVELARALAARPRLLLLDEPAGGLNHEEVDGARRASSGGSATTSS